MKQLQIISINHAIHDTNHLIKLNLNDEKWEMLFSYIRNTLNIASFLKLSTCNRLEIYFEAEKKQTESIINTWLALAEYHDHLTANDFIQIYGTSKSLRYILELSAGFKSAIFGDDQIIYQLKKAFETARINHTLGTIMERCYQRMMRSHKQICNKTHFRNTSVSVAYQSLKYLERRFGKQQLSQSTLLIIGAGQMAEELIKYLSKFEFDAIAIMNRTMSKAEKLIQSTTIELKPYKTINKGQYNFIISCTDQGYDLIEDLNALDFYIDLSISSVNRSIDQNNGFVLNDIRNYINKQKHEQLSCTPEVNQIIKEQLKEFELWYRNWLNRRLHSAA